MLELFRAIAALLITLGLLAGFAYLARRYGFLNGSFSAPNANKRIKIVEQTFLDAKGTRLMIIDVDGEQSLLMLAPNGAKILKTLETKNIAVTPAKEGQ